MTPLRTGSRIGTVVEKGQDYSGAMGLGEEGSSIGSSETDQVACLRPEPESMGFEL